MPCGYPDESEYDVEVDFEAIFNADLDTVLDDADEDVSVPA